MKKTIPETSRQGGHLGYLLSAYLFDSLSAAGREDVESHLAHCAECRAELEALRHTFGEVEVALDEGGKEYVFEERRRQRVLAFAKRSRLYPEPTSIFSGWKIKALAAMLMVAVLVSVMTPPLLRSRKAVNQTAAASASKAFAEAEEIYRRTDAPADAAPSRGPAWKSESKPDAMITGLTEQPAEAPAPESIYGARNEARIAPRRYKSEVPSADKPERRSDDLADATKSGALAEKNMLVLGHTQKQQVQLSQEARPKPDSKPTDVLALHEEERLEKPAAKESLDSRPSGGKQDGIAYGFDGSVTPAPASKMTTVPPAGGAGNKLEPHRRIPGPGKIEGLAKVEIRNSTGAPPTPPPAAVVPAAPPAPSQPVGAGRISEAKKSDLDRPRARQSAGEQNVFDEAPAEPLQAAKELKENLKKLEGEINELSANMSKEKAAERDTLKRAPDSQQQAAQTEGKERGLDSNLSEAIDSLKILGRQEEDGKNSIPKSNDLEITDARIPNEARKLPETTQRIQNGREQGKSSAGNELFFNDYIEGSTTRQFVQGTISNANPASEVKQDVPAEYGIKLKRGKDASDIVVPPDVLDKAALGDHFETINLDKPDTQSAFGNPDAAKLNINAGDKLAKNLDVLSPNIGESTFGRRKQIVRQSEVFPAAKLDKDKEVDTFLNSIDGDIDGLSRGTGRAATPGVSGNDGVLEYAASLKTIEERVLVTPERTVSESVPAEYKDGVLQKPATRREIKVPPVYEIRQREVRPDSERARPNAMEHLLRGYRYFRAQNPRLSLQDYLRRPAPVPPIARGDDGLDEDEYIQRHATRPFVDCARDKFSTFSMDVDTASYALSRSRLRQDELPDPEAVRVEEFVNYFKQPYEVTGDDAFGVFAEAAPSPFTASSDMPASKSADGISSMQSAPTFLKIGIKSRQPRPNERKPAMLTFAIDTSGSMTKGDRLELVRAALKTLLAQLNPEDAICIVGFSDQAELLLPRTQARQSQRILDAINAMTPHGSTNVESGLNMAYRVADEAFSPEAVNRVILCSDGVANVGAKGPDEILKLVKVFAGRGIDLYTVGFGLGQYNDKMMVQLADNGNGSAHFVDSQAEAAKIFSEQLPPHLNVLARDAKVQVEFNPDVVERYRLLGYEKRKIADKDFRNDAIDAAEVAHDTLITALYEIIRKPAGQGALGKVFLRWKDAGHRHLPVVERNYPLSEGIVAAGVRDASPQLRFLACVARFAELLRDSRWTRESSFGEVLTQLNQLPEEFKARDDWKEVQELVTRAQALTLRKWMQELKR